MVLDVCSCSNFGLFASEQLEDRGGELLIL